MRTTTPLALLAILALFAQGCQHTGLSANETPTQNYATYIMSLYDSPNAAPAPARPLSLPARIAIAQVGEIAPPAKMLQTLRSDLALSRVEPVPGLFAESGLYYDRPRENPQEQIHLQVQRMQRFSKDLGMDYLFIFGGSIDYGTHSNPLSLLDLTIIGAYIVPGKNVKATGRAAGALIDLSTGHVVFVTSVESEKERLTSTASSDGQEQLILASMREEMIDNLGKKMLAECRQHAGVMPAAAYIAPTSSAPAPSTDTIPAGAVWQPGR
jgi:rhombotail lipoprotein